MTDRAKCNNIASMTTVYLKFCLLLCSHIVILIKYNFKPSKSCFYVRLARGRFAAYRNQKLYSNPKTYKKYLLLYGGDPRFWHEFSIYTSIYLSIALFLRIINLQIVQSKSMTCDGDANVHTDWGLESAQNKPNN